MKSILPPVLVLSLVLNLFFGYQWLQRSDADQTPASAEANAETPNASAPGTDLDSSEDNTPAPRLVRFDWQQVESEDYRDYIDNLRAIGCPEATIRDIIQADVKKLYESKMEALKPQQKEFEYWKTGNTWMTAMQPDAETMEERNALNREKREVLKALLGEDFEPDTHFLEAMVPFNPFDQMLDFLSPSKKSSIMEIYQKWSAEQAKLATGGAMDQEDMKMFHELQKQRDLELAQLLSPEEKRAYDLRMSESAMNLRMQLNGFDPTKEEFEAIFDIKKAFDDEYGILAMAYNDSESREAYQQAQNQTEKDIASILGEERYEEYQMVKDYTYQGLKKASERYIGNADSAPDLFRAMQTAQQSAQQIRSNNDLDVAQKREMLQGIRSETEAMLIESFGEQGFESYQKENYAHWIKQLDRGYTDEEVIERYVAPTEQPQTTEAIDP